MSNYTKLHKVGDIDSISISKNAIITCKNHDLDNNKFIEIRNSALPINGSYKAELNIFLYNQWLLI